MNNWVLLLLTLSYAQTPVFPGRSRELGTHTATAGVGQTAIDHC